MNYLKIPEILENIIGHLDYDIDLISLMQTCISTRNIIGSSPIWKKFLNDHDHVLRKYINIEEIFKLFMDIKIINKNFHIRDYYGKWYYLYVMKTWMVQDCTFWSLEYLIEHKDDLKKIPMVASLIYEPSTAHMYDKWIYFLDKILDIISGRINENHTIFLSYIYLNAHLYNNRCTRNMIYITNRRIKYVQDSGWVPLDSRIKFDKDHIYYDLKYDKHENYLEIVDDEGNEFIYDTAGECIEKISEITNSLNVDFNEFVYLLQIIFGKGDIAVEHTLIHLITGESDSESETSNDEIEYVGQETQDQRNEETENVNQSDDEDYEDVKTGLLDAINTVRNSLIDFGSDISSVDIVDGNSDISDIQRVYHELMSKYDVLTS